MPRLAGSPGLCVHGEETEVGDGDLPAVPGQGKGPSADLSHGRATELTLLLSVGLQHLGWQEVAGEVSGATGRGCAVQAVLLPVAPRGQW